MVLFIAIYSLRWGFCIDDDRDGFGGFDAGDAGGFWG